MGLNWPGIKVSTVRTELGRKDTADEDAKLPNEVAEWISAHFKQAPLSGKVKQTIKLKSKAGKATESFGGDYVIDLSWRFESA